MISDVGPESFLKFQFVRKISAYSKTRRKSPPTVAVASQLNSVCILSSYIISYH